ncbi:MAG: DNA/RNA non-specific endonuclease [Janthinobacterium lividum]
MEQSLYLPSRIRSPSARFGTYLRTGLGLDLDDGGVELKFNPWHDPATGRFTFKGGGDGTWGGGGFTGGGGGSFGGGGASGSWGGPAKPQTGRSGSQGIAGSDQQDAPVVQSVPASVTSPAGTTVTRHGYTYQIDGEGRTTQVSGTLTLNPDQPRSRSAQAAAGGTDRLPTDDGGHYVAARFDGPTDSFNHFAQDANFNRGGYRMLESQWAKDVKHGNPVWVQIVPGYVGSSQRPSTINVVYSVNGQRGFRQFPNSSKGKPHGK